MFKPCNYVIVMYYFTKNVITTHTHSTDFYLVETIHRLMFLCVFSGDKENQSWLKHNNLNHISQRI